MKLAGNKDETLVYDEAGMSVSFGESTIKGGNMPTTRQGRIGRLRQEFIRAQEYQRLRKKGKEFDEAEKEFLAAIECSPSLAEAYVSMGGICLQRDDLDGCLDWNRRATKARPGFSEGWGNIGFVHLQRGEVDDAIKALEKSTVFNFRFVQAFASLGSAYMIKGDLDKSIENSEKALKLAPEFAVAHNNLGIAYLEKGENEKAKTHILKAKELGYDVAPEILQEIEG